MAIPSAPPTEKQAAAWLRGYNRGCREMRVKVGALVKQLRASANLIHGVYEHDGDFENCEVPCCEWNRAALAPWKEASDG